MILVGPEGAGASAGGACTTGPVIVGAPGVAEAAGAAAGEAEGAWDKILVQWEKKISSSVSEKRG